MGYLEETPIVQNEAEADALLSKIESPEPFDATKEVNAEAVAADGGEAKVADPLPAKPKEEAKHKIIWKGKELELPISKIISHAQQGYDYQEKMRLLNTEKASIESQKTKYQDFDKRLAEYKQVEDYIKKDPQWWEHVRTSYQTRMKETGSVSSDPVIQELSETVKGLKGYIDSEQERKKAELMVKEDTELDMEIKEFRDQHPEFGWNTLDENGHDLERRIGQHMLSSGIKSFRAAARDLLFDEMIKRNEVKAKEALGKDIQKATKLGLGPVRTESRAKVSKPTSVRNKSYDELAAEGIKEAYGS